MFLHGARVSDLQQITGKGLFEIQGLGSESNLGLNKLVTLSYGRSESVEIGKLRVSRESHKTQRSIAYRLPAARIRNIQSFFLSSFIVKLINPVRHFKALGQGQRVAAP